MLPTPSTCIVDTDFIASRDEHNGVSERDLQLTIQHRMIDFLTAGKR